MSDRELLELAAKAAGYDTIIEMYGFNDFGEPLLDANDPPTVWNPLTDDGDALRLAVKLKLLIDGCSHCVQTMEQDFDWFYGESAGDEYAKTRRAIVRAAAEIGKAMT